ncbi:MAG: hypothetical protein ACRD0D_15055 [Acidimicrobiales bacterium]
MTVALPDGLPERHQFGQGGFYDARVRYVPGRLPASGGPSALPPVRARVVAFVVIIVAGLCGLAIGRGLVTIQCNGSCETSAGFGALAGAILGSGGVAVVAVLVLRAMGEWRAGPGGRRR